MRLTLLAASALAFAACSESKPAEPAAAAPAPEAAAPAHDMSAMDDAMKSADASDDANTAAKEDMTAIVDAAVAHCEKIGNRMLLVDIAPGVALTDEAAVNKLDLPTSTYAVTYYPWTRINNPHYNPDTNPAADRTVLVSPGATTAPMVAVIDADMQHDERVIPDMIARMQATVDRIDPVDADMAIIREALARGIQDYTACVDWIVATYGSDIRAVHAGAVPFLKLAGIVCGGWQLARAADIATRRLAEEGCDRDFLNAKVITARFYAEHLMTRVAGLRQTMIHGAASTMALPAGQF